MARREGGRGFGRRAAAVAGRQRPGHVATDGRAWPLKTEEVATDGPHGTVPVGRVKRHSIDLKINLN
jgi:hypothetical protein